MADSDFEDGDFAEDEQRILEIVLEHGGAATTKQLEDETDLNSGQIYYRLDKLESGGWISVQEGSSSRDGPGRPPKEAVLTKRSVDLLDLDELEGAIVIAGGSGADVSVIRDQVETAREELASFDEAVDSLTERLDALQNAFDALQDGVDD